MRHPTATHRIRFCTSSDGVRIGYATGGDGWPFVKTPNWLNHLELDVSSPIWKAWIERIARRHTLVRYDARGCGISDRDVGFSFATNRLDLEAVVDAAGLSRFVLYGASQGAAIAIEYAALHPDRVSHLILYGGYLRGAARRDSSPAALEEARTLVRIVEVGWGRDNPAFRQVFASQFIPDSSIEQLRAFDEIQRQTVSHAAAAMLLASFHDVDVSGCAARVRCPTLVMHARQDARVPFEEGRQVAGAIAGAEFVPLDSRNHILLEHQPAWQRFFDEIDDFLRRHPTQAGDEGRSRFGQLTPAEMRVLDLIATGRNNAAIAANLAISEKTVRNHINRIFDKLGVHDRSQAIVLARDAGLGRGGT
jgi:pimeloyl-ACP methyl ester carboxylesterase/DNA-binding CsgD family transcriptional regulator